MTHGSRAQSGSGRCYRADTGLFLGRSDALALELTTSATRVIVGLPVGAADLGGE